MTPERETALRLVANTEVRLGTAQRAGSHYELTVALGYLEKAQLIERYELPNRKGVAEPYAEITETGRRTLARIQARVDTARKP